MGEDSFIDLLEDSNDVIRRFQDTDTDESNSDTARKTSKLSMPKTRAKKRQEQQKEETMRRQPSVLIEKLDKSVLDGLYKSVLDDLEDDGYVDNRNSSIDRLCNLGNLRSKNKNRVVEPAESDTE